MSTYTGVTNCQKQSGFLAHPVFIYVCMTLSAYFRRRKRLQRPAAHVRSMDNLCTFKRHLKSHLSSQLSLPIVTLCQRLRFVLHDFGAL